MTSIRTFLFLAVAGGGLALGWFAPAAVALLALIVLTAAGIGVLLAIAEPDRYPWLGAWRSRADEPEVDAE